MSAQPQLFEERDPTAVELFDYQAEAVQRLRENIRREIRNQVLSAPTGSGKTEIALYMIQSFLAKERRRGRGLRCAFVVDRLALIRQTSQRMFRYDVPHGVIQANHPLRNGLLPVQLCSIHTIKKRGWPKADIIIIDECHSRYREIIERIGKRDCIVIGLTATPHAKGLGQDYDAIVSVTTTNRLIETGRLAPYRIFAASEPDMRGAKLHKGEWEKNEAAKRALPLVGDCVQEYLKHCEGQKFLAFGANIAHCVELQKQFMDAGVQCALYTSKTHPTECEQLVRDFSDRDSYLRGLVSVAKLAKGFDAPCVECIIMARPLRRSFMEHVQTFGRGLRFDPDNPAKVLTVLDHAGNCVRMWDRMMDFFENGASELDDGKKKPKQSTTRERKPMKCPRCHAVHAPRPSCSSCGYEYPRQSGIKHVAGTLSELGGSSKSGDDLRSLHAQLAWIAREKNWPHGWVAHRYRERTGMWPPRIVPQPEPPSEALKRWVRSQLIRWAKSRKAG